MTDRYTIKIAYIGGGSRYWASELMGDLALAENLNGEIALYDIDFPAAQRNVGVAEKIFTAPAAKTKFDVRATEDPKDALRDADFVVCSIEPGPIEMRYADLKIPEKYGILQTVGDTVGPGGLVRNLRAIPIKMHYGHLVMECCPRAWVINYTNPMTLCTQAFYEAEPEIKAFGCCHEVFGTQANLGRLVKEWFHLPEKPPRHDIVLDIAGVNHFTLATQAHWNGHDLFPRLYEMISQPGFFDSQAADARHRKAERKFFGGTGHVRWDFLRNFGVIGAAGDRHLMEFVPWYLTSEDSIQRWGTNITPYEWRYDNAKRPALSADSYDQRSLNPSGEEGVDQILALLGAKPLTTNVNIPNMGQMTQAPPGFVVETYAQFGRDCVRPLLASPLPPPAWALVDRTIEEQRTIMMAARENSFELALQALLLDPLVHRNTDQAAKMLREMMLHCKDHLPGWKL